VTPSASAGNLAIVDCIVTALGGNGITITGASTTLTLLNSQVLVQAGNTVAPISVAGIYSIINTIYDKPGSTITGTSTNSVDYFQYIDADNITAKGLTITGSVTATQGFTGSLFGTASFASTAISSSFASTASFYAMPVSAFAFTSGYGNLTNNVDNTMKYDTQVINNRPDIFELSGSGTTDARIFVKQPGIYEFISQINMFDAFNNVDFVVKLNSGSAFGAMGLVSLFNDEKYAESTSARTLNGTIIVNVPTSQYYSVALNPSANSPFPSNNFNTPTRLFIKKLA
jgi:hypothetical protein